MRFTQLRDFIAVIQAGSIRAAARALGISQPALTKSIRQLEEELHVKLLQRSGRGAIATRVGKAFLARARVIQSELAKIEGDLSELRGEHGGSIVVGASPATVFLIVPDAVKRLRHRLPHVRIRLVEGLTQSLVPLVRDETLDFAIGQSAGARPDNAIRFAPLISVHLIIAGRRNHPLAAAKSLRELAEAPWVAFAPPGQADFLRRAYEAVGMAPPRDVVQCGSYASALALMMHTDALGMIVPQLLAEPQMRGSLQQIRIAEPLPTLTFGMFRRADAPLSAAAKAMAEAVSATARILARDNR